ncbi:MAG: cell wall metabolism sensor histidine kinase WalK [Pseudobutyrivibrio sp.]|nr:cell wall metabolism sensor histidine kinase WalK [Pseudobutyrivibrio sp.]
MEKKRFSFIHSLGFNIGFIILAVGLIPFLVCAPIALHAYKEVTIHTDAANIMAQALRYTNEIVTSGYVEGKDNKKLDHELTGVAESYGGRILIVNSSLEIVRDTFSVDEGKTAIWVNVINSMHGQSQYYYDQSSQGLIVTIPLTSSDGEVVGSLVINKSLDYVTSNYDSFLAIALIMLAVVFSITFVVAIVFSARRSHAITSVSKDLDGIIRESVLTIPEKKSFNELEKLVKKFNQVLEKLHAIDDSRQEFVSNVSHELKTPLASMKVLADSINGADEVPVEMYKEFMGDIGNEIDRETQIINDLLSLVRMDKSGASLTITAVNINELTEHILKRLQPIAEKSDIDVVFESFRPVIAEVDEVKFSLVITNLVENAIKYNNPGGWVHITLNSDHQFCYIKVEDNGLGIPEEALPHVFERFYRADKSHSREIGGTGLGLAITKSAIAMHNGDIKVHSTLGEGTVFDVRVPLNYIQKGAK